jgi:hypothetical protein
MHGSTLLLGALLGAALTFSTQDPVKPTTPATPAVIDEATAAKDVPGRPPRHVLEGFYELNRRVVEGVDELQKSRGYLAITNRHMVFCVVAGGPDPDVPLLRGAVHEWQSEGESLRRVVKLSYFTDGAGGVNIDPTGSTERRRIEFVRGGVRVLQDNRNWLDFTRLE